MKYIPDYESERWKIMKSKISPGVMIYDKLLDKIAADIDTGNLQIDEYIAKSVYLCIHDNDFLQYVMKYGG